MTEEHHNSLFTLKQLSHKISTGQVSPVKLLDIHIERIKKINPALDAFITVTEEDAYKEAEIAARDIANGKYLSPLHGIPYSVKDIFYAKGMRCTVGSRVLANYVPNYDATVISRMKKAGAILIGKNNLDEFAFGITGENPYYGSSKNPWDSSRISGGSSGGSAVAVATGIFPLSMGTVTGGSLRAPASLCGVVGLMQTFGLICRIGVFPVAPSMDHVGCITKSVWDAAAILEQISGWDPLDESTTQRKVPAYTKIIEENPGNSVSVAIPKRFFREHLQHGVESLFDDFVKTLELTGITVNDVHLNHTDNYYKPNLDIARAEAAEIHSGWLKERPDDYSEDIKEKYRYGLGISAVDYIGSKQLIKKIRRELLNTLKSKADIIAVPTTIIAATTFGEKEVTLKDKSFSVNDALTWNNIIFYGTGLPAISIPIGLTKDRLPVGVQLVGPPFEEDKLLTMAYRFECKNNNLLNTIPPTIQN
jgi:aspartyl-tRNA(Asn)/glutamyl-tRNA(Gln) amidotransferase subunit A